MLYKYCPNCYSLNIKFDSNKNIHICLSCNYQGEIKKDSIDKINSYRKQKLSSENNNQNNNQNTGLNNKQQEANKNTQETIENKVKQKFNTIKNDDWELL